MSELVDAALRGDAEAVRRLVALDSSGATEALRQLCHSELLRRDRGRAPDFHRAAEALLDAGADPNGHAMYGAAGVAHDPELTRLLLARGADPNDDETPYHAPEFYDNRAMEVLVESGKLTPDNVVLMLVRKLDWIDYDAVAWLLARGANPNAINRRTGTALHHSLQRDNPLRFIELLVDHGADPTIARPDGVTAVAFAARLGRADGLDLFERRGFEVGLEQPDAFLAACARGVAFTGDSDVIARVRSEDPAAVARFAGAGNVAGVRILLDLGFDVAARGGRPGEPGGTALHLAVWRERPEVVRLLIERGAPLDAVNSAGHTPLDLARRAQVEYSEFTPHGSTEIIELLTAAGARQ